MPALACANGASGNERASGALFVPSVLFCIALVGSRSCACLLVCVCAHACYSLAQAFVCLRGVVIPALFPLWQGVASKAARWHVPLVGCAFAPVAAATGLWGALSARPLFLCIAVVGHVWHVCVCVCGCLVFQFGSRLSMCTWTSHVGAGSRPTSQGSGLLFFHWRVHLVLEGVLGAVLAAPLSPKFVGMVVMAAPFATASRCSHGLFVLAIGLS